MQYLINNHDSWNKTTDLKPIKMNKPFYMGKILLTKARQLPCEMYAYLGKKKNNISSRNMRKKG